MVGNHEESRVLLSEVFPHEDKYQSLTYLDWLYGDNPSGKVIDSNIDDSRGRVGHYAVVPQFWTKDGASFRAVLSLNTAVSERARGQGLFTQLAKETYLKAEEQKITTVIGVANANSTPGFIKNLGFQLIGPMKVQMYLGWSFCRVVEIQLLDLARFQTQIEQRNRRRTSQGATRTWSLTELNWRLANPVTRYRVTEVKGHLIVSKTLKFFFFRVTVILKVFVEDPDSLFKLGPIARSIARSDNSIGAIYGGQNLNLIPGGVKIPEFFKPSPLNIISRVPKGEEDKLFFATFEFLDFDAY